LWIVTISNISIPWSEGIYIDTRSEFFWFLDYLATTFQVFTNR